MPTSFPLANTRVLQPGAQLPAFPPLPDPPRKASNGPQTISPTVITSNPSDPPLSAVFPFVTAGVIAGILIFGAVGSYFYNRFYLKETVDGSSHGGAFGSHTNNKHMSMMPPTPTAAPLRFATYPTLSRSGGPGIIEQRNEYIIEDTKSEDGVQYAEYDTLGRSGGPGIVEQRREFEIHPDYSLTAQPMRPRQPSAAKLYLPR